MTFLVGPLLDELRNQRHDEQLRQIPKYRIAEDLGSLKTKLFGHNVSLPNDHKVVLCKNCNFTFDLCLKKGLDRIEPLALILQKVHDVSRSKFGVSYRREWVSLMALHRYVAADNDVNLVTLKEYKLL